MHYDIGTVIDLTITVVHSRFFVSLAVHGVDKLRGDSVKQEHLKEMIPSEVLRQMVAELLPSALEANRNLFLARVICRVFKIQRGPHLLEGIQEVSFLDMTLL